MEAFTGADHLFIFLHYFIQHLSIPNPLSDTPRDLKHTVFTF